MRKITYVISQADLLNALAPMLTTRSDTFTIRAYGSAQNALSGELLGQAWCEARIQRIVPPVDEGTDLKQNTDLVNPSGPFGRRFVVLDFRWLPGSEIEEEK